MNNTAKILILENRLGQKVRTFAVASKNMNVVYLKDQRRIEALADLKTLEENDIEYTLLKTLDISKLNERGTALNGLGHIRLANSEMSNSPEYHLSRENDDEELKEIQKKTLTYEFKTFRGQAGR